MYLTQPEIIQILRKRAGMSQGVLGARAFETSHASGRTKIKNIELGRQTPTAADLQKMAAVLNVPVQKLGPPTAESRDRPPESRLRLNRQLLDHLPGIALYFDLLNKAAALNDSDLMGHISGKLAAQFHRFAGTLSLKPARHELES